MNSHSFIRHVKESFQSMFRNRWMSLASISAVTVTLLLVGLFLLLMMNVNKIAADIENDVEVKVLIDIGIDESERTALQQSISELSTVDDVKYSSKEQELQILIRDFGEDLTLFDQENPLNDVFYVKAIDPQHTEKVAAQILKMDGVKTALYGKGKIDKLFGFMNTMRNIGIVLIVALLLTAAFLISNTIKLTIAARSTEIEIMKLVGARNSFIRIPFILEGAWLGLFGAIVPIIFVTIAYVNIYHLFAPKLENESFHLLEITPFIIEVNFFLIVIGVIIGMLGSFFSVRKFLKV